MPTEKVSAVIPAYNEEKTIEPIIRELKNCQLVDEVIVVDDGSDDDTAKITRLADARVISRKNNTGKSAAMESGVKAAKNSIIMFVDADITGFTAQKMEKIILPVLNGNRIMYIGVIRRRAYWLNKIMRFLPLISGLRVIKKELWLKIPNKYKRGYQMEIALNYFAKTSGQKVGHCFLEGIRHVIKEKKRGPLLGILARIKMGLEIMLIGWRLYVIHRIAKLLNY
ncbi:MAG: glycosyltransferase family 2 protein [Candidatus Magasanikbacteria bacterium]|nr:glycosyltransferase family 2 protein [Candidatus Magasanikbacteria bacterium]